MSRKSFYTLFIGLVFLLIGILAGGLLKKTPPVSFADTIAGEYHTEGRYFGGARITEILAPPYKNKREYRISIYTGSTSGCMGDFVGYGLSENGHIRFIDLNQKCTMRAALSKDKKELEIEQSEACRAFSGMNCIFSGSYKRVGKFIFFSELESLKTSHPVEVLKASSVNSAMIDLLGGDGYNLLFDRIEGSSIPGSAGAKDLFIHGEEMYCADGIMPGFASSDAAIYCLNYATGEVQAAIMVDGAVKILNRGKIWGEINSWATIHSRSK